MPASMTLTATSRARIGFVRELLRAVANRGVDRCTGKLRYAVRQVAGTSALRSGALPDQSRLGQNAAQRRRCRTISSVNGRKSLD